MIFLRIYLLCILFIFYNTAFAEDTLWDMDGLVSQVQNSQGVNLISNNGFSKTLSKEYNINESSIKKMLIQEMIK
jgi:hypothetical protein